MSSDGACFMARVDPVNNLTLSYNYCHEAPVPIFTRGGNGITVEHSMFANNGTGSTSVHREFWSCSAEDNVTVRHNYITKIRSTGFIGMMNGGGAANNWSIYGNIFYNPNTVGSYPWDTGDGPIGIKTPDMYPVNWKIYNNTVVGIYGWFANWGLAPGGSGNVSQNNIWFNNFAQYIGSGSYAAGSSNWAYGNRNYMNGGGASTDSQISKEGVIGTSDPFVNSANGDFRLKYAIPGKPLDASFNQDMYGNLRGADGVWDIGAVEFGSGPGGGPPTAPLNVRIVSP